MADCSEVHFTGNLSLHSCCSKRRISRQVSLVSLEAFLGTISSSSFLERFPSAVSYASFLHQLLEKFPWTFFYISSFKKFLKRFSSGTFDLLQSLLCDLLSWSPLICAANCGGYLPLTCLWLAFSLPFDLFGTLFRTLLDTFQAFKASQHWTANVDTKMQIRSR